MEIHENVTIRSFTRFKRTEPIVKDHTAVIMYKFCPRKYFYQIVLGFRPKETAPFFAWGSAYHKFRETLEIQYNASLKEEKSKPEAMEAAMVQAVNDGMQWWKKHGKEQPLGSKYEFMTAARLMKTLMTVYQWWKKEKELNVFTVVASEQPFNVALGESITKPGVFEFTGGRFDQIVRWNGRLWGRDFKTSSQPQGYYERGLTPNDQFIRYTFAESKLQGERVHGQIIECVFNNKKDGPTIKPYTVSFTPEQVETWRKEQIEHWLPTIDRSRELDQYPLSEHSCKYCPFHLVCKSPSEASMMAKLESDYKHEPWDHTKTGLGAEE